MLVRVREAYGDHFPPHVTIFDSGPGLYDFHRCLNGATSGLPRWLWVATWPGSALIVILYATLYAGRRDAFRYWFEKHNEVVGEARRAYIYGENDEMIASSHVERHAREAQKNGYVVQMEKFAGSGHVLHMRQDEKRYWTIVNEVWEGSKAASPKL
jgi:pimeloyl-ACP methyl ester carboxylesterase